MASGRVAARLAFFASSVLSKVPATAYQALQQQHNNGVGELGQRDPQSEAHIGDKRCEYGGIREHSYSERKVEDVGQALWRMSGSREANELSRWRQSGIAQSTTGTLSGGIVQITFTSGRRCCGRCVMPMLWAMRDAYHTDPEQQVRRALPADRQLV